MPCAVSPDLAAAAEICSAVATPATRHLHTPEASASAWDAGLSAAHAAPMPGSSSSNSPGLLQPVDERAAAASAAAVAAAAALPMSAAAPVSGRRASPFAMGYNFGGLAESTGAAAAAGGSLPGNTGTHVQEITAAGASSSGSPQSHADNSSSSLVGGCAVDGLSQAAQHGHQQQHTSSSSNSHTASFTSNPRPSNSGSSGCTSGSAAPSGAGGKGTGLQHLVSISAQAAPGCCSTGVGVTGHSQPHADAVRAAVSSPCPSSLQQPSDSGLSSLQLSSSTSGPVLQPSSTGRGPLSGGM